jgi:predicted deacylase
LERFPVARDCGAVRVVVLIRRNDSFVFFLMTTGVAKLGLDLKTLAPGFHRRRFQASDVGFDAWIWRGTAGPVLLLNGATHGDEYEGPTLLRTWAENWRPSELRGTVVMVPVLNEVAFFAGRRCHPADEGNLARAFPGNARGSATAQLAHLFDTQLLAQATHYVDLHSGGIACELLPWVGYFNRDDRIGRTQREMARCFDRFWNWAGPFLPGRTLSAAHQRGIPAIYVECRGAGGVEAHDLDALERGLQHLLQWANCVSGAAPKLARQKTRTAIDENEAHLQIHHPAPHDGLFVSQVKLGHRVRKGAILGSVHALGGGRPHVVKAESSGRVVLVRYQRSVLKGDALFALAPI